MELFTKKSLKLHLAPENHTMNFVSAIERNMKRNGPIPIIGKRVHFLVINLNEQKKKSVDFVPIVGS